MSVQLFHRPSDLEGLVREVLDGTLEVWAYNDPPSKNDLFENAIEDPDISTWLETGQITDDELDDAINAVWADYQRKANR